MPLWTDLQYDMKSTNTNSQGAYYILTASTISVEWLGHCNYSNIDRCKFQFSLAYSTALPGVWTFRYYDVFGDGLGATVGVQGPNYGRATQFSYDADKVPAGTQVVCDTNAGTCVSSRFT